MQRLKHGVAQRSMHLSHEGGTELGRGAQAVLLAQAGQQGRKALKLILARKVL